MRVEKGLVNEIAALARADCNHLITTRRVEPSLKRKGTRREPQGPDGASVGATGADCGMETRAEKRLAKRHDVEMIVAWRHGLE